MIEILLSLLAGILTVFAPCILPLLPIILGGSLNAATKDRWRPYIITASLVTSLILFTILLKATTVLIGVEPSVWTYVSGGLVITLGLFMLFPDAWVRVVSLVGLEQRSQQLLGSAGSQKSRTLSAVLTGAALGPVFSSCSPTYAWVIATVLPAEPVWGLFLLAVYCAGLAAALLAIALLGRKLLSRVRWASNPRGWFQRGIAIVFILVGLFLITGWDKQIQTWFVQNDPFNLIDFEQKLVPGAEPSRQSANAAGFNVTPYTAPELTGIDDWINSQPLELADLKGKVVVIDFWTYSCINCQRTQPYLNDWYSKYHKEGLEIIGVHAPEFSFERVKKNVAQAVEDEAIKYPVALDNSFATWQAYDNRYWPAKYVVDAEGKVRYEHFGEGAYDETERVIQALLAEKGATDLPTVVSDETPPSALGQTPETYLGYARTERFSNSSEFKADEAVTYSLDSSPSNGYWSLGGTWSMGKESSVAGQAGATLVLSFTGSEVYLVMDGPRGARVQVTAPESTPTVDRGKDGAITLDGPRLYHIAHYSSQQQGRAIKLTFPDGASVNAFTFGTN